MLDIATMKDQVYVASLIQGQALLLLRYKFVLGKSKNLPVEYCVLRVNQGLRIDELIFHFDFLKENLPEIIVMIKTEEGNDNGENNTFILV